MVRFILILPLFFLANTVLSQTGIKGKLVDNTTSSSIEFASLALYTERDSSLVDGIISTANGTFELIGIKSNSYYLVIQSMGFDTRVISDLQIAKNEVQDLGVIKISANQKVLEEIKISGEKLNTIHQVDRQVYEVDQFQNAQGGTASDVLKNMPSISIDGEGELSVRGTSGFVVLLNGKPIQSSPSMLLSQLPANAIKNVEVITTPSAKYDSEGKAGIINILTNKITTDGIYAQTNIKIGAPSIESYDNADPAYRYGADFTFSQQKNKWNWSLGGSYQRNDKTGRREGDVWTEIYDNVENSSGKRTRFPSEGERSFDEINYSGRFALGYQMNPRNEFNMSFYGGVRDKTRLADIHYYNNTNTSIPNDAVIGQSQYYNHNSRNRTGDFVLGSLDYTHHFENASELSTSFLYEYTLLGGPTFNDNQTIGFNNSPTNNELIVRERNTNDNPLHGIRVNLDYHLKPSDIGLWEIGYQFRQLDHKGDFLYESQNLINNLWVPVPEFSSNLNLNRVIHSGYLQLSGKKNRWDYGAGIRLEHMNRRLDFKGINDLETTVLKREYTRFFPSANLQYVVNDDLRLKTSYSKRVERTTTFKMNPFKEKEHSETLEQGDAHLEPEFIDLVEVGVIKDIRDHSFFANVYFRYTENLINRTNTVDSDTVLNRIYTNVGTGTAIGLELGLDLKLTQNWKWYMGGNVYQNTIKGSFNEFDVNKTDWQYSVNMNTTYDLSKTLSVNLSFNYLSERITAQGRDSKYYSPNLIVKKTFLDNRLTASVQWLNIDLGLLETNEQRITTKNDGYVDPNDGIRKAFFTTTNYVYETDWVVFNISYNFTQFKNKAKFVKSEFGAKEF